MSEELKKDNTRLILAVFLIVAGILWFVRTIGLHFNLPDFPWDHIFSPFRNIFHRITGFIFSWQMVLIIVGLILMAGNRKTGLILVITGGIFIIPKMFAITGLSASLIFPVALIVTGVVLVSGRNG